jgi:hypothetical protein
VCSSQAVFWLLNLISSALLYMVLIPLGMPLRYRSMRATQVISMLPIVYSDSLRCSNAFSCCTHSLDWYGQAANMLTQLCRMMPFPTAIEPMSGKAACVGVHFTIQVVVGFCMVMSLAFDLERRQRAAFARQVGRREVYLTLLRRRKKRTISACNVYLVFITIWQFGSLVLPKLFP